MGKKARLADVVHCCKVRFDRGDAMQWKHGDFVDLNREMQRYTNTNISPSTLKRIFGKIAVDDDYVPQQATLDALIKYGRYVTPENLQPELRPVIEPKPVVPLIGQTGNPKKTGPSKRFIIILITLIAIAGAVSLITWRNLKPKNIAGKIHIARIEGHLPVTAFFDLQLPKMDDSLFVNFGDKSPVIYVGAGEKKAAHIYYIPGVFTVSVQTRHQTIATTSTYISSNNWLGLVFHNQQDIPDHFYKFPAVKTGSDSLFQVNNSQVDTMGLDTTGVILTRFCNYTPITANADNFVFEAAFQNIIPEKSNYCRGTQFQIAGSNSMIRFKLVSPGCSLRVLNFVSEQTYNGATTDLSRFVQDLSQWNTVKIVNHNKQVSLYVNSKQIFTGAYQRTLGDIRGLFLEFEGAGFVKTCDLTSYDGKVFYHF